MKRLNMILIVVGALLLVVPIELAARGPGGGGGGARAGGGAAARPSGGAAARPAAPAARPAPTPAARPAAGAARSPAISAPVAGANRPATANVARPNPGTGAATRPATGAVTRPSPSQLNNFVDAGRPATGAIGAGGNAGRGGAAADFLGGQGGARPAQLPAGAAGRNGVGAGVAAGVGAGVGVGVGAGVAAGAGRQNLASNRPSRVENRQQLQDNRQQRRDEIRGQVRDNHPRLDFWANNPNWARWRINAPYRWAAWGALTGWFGWGNSYSETTYAYGDNVYYSNDQVYYGDAPVATAEEYADQAAAIAASAPQNLDPSTSEWMPLGVFVATQDREATGPDPTLFLQLAVNKEGVISGTFSNMATGDNQTIEGMVDKKSQRVAWCVEGKSWPIVETGLSSLTKDSFPVLVHFEDGQTQQWLLVRLEEPKT